MPIAEIEQKVTLLKETFQKAPGDADALARCVTLLAELKRLLAVHTLQNVVASEKFWLLSRDVYEIGILVSISSGDIESFEGFCAQIHPFYFDYTKVLKPSGCMDVIVGIRMLHLLTENRIGDFYMLLELLPQDIRQSHNVCHVIELEKAMMEGNLSRLIEVNKAAPCEYYKSLSYKLADTARSKIAASMEVAYASLSLDVATRMLKLSNVNETVAFLTYINQQKTVNDEPYVKWIVDGDRINFVSEEATRCGFSSKEMLVYSLKGIEELEKIV
ncbi:26S proteasome non-ATPase regulatory subunit 8 like protein [Babesia gibsoni]|uniref:26S proteasome non-ATPase regulatory subunit 8 like protein n=1 Tax=Babesia gibsoni TaxID=33632 RepID=A0AAD8PGU9_BABGI|nr:26S proteasome non-ATPase regulatory subunit 8 like protein [Babesia gibsoni]